MFISQADICRIKAVRVGKNSQQQDTVRFFWWECFPELMQPEVGADSLNL